MLTVKTVLKESSGRGIGLFADQTIEKDQTWWIPSGFFDLIIAPEILENFDDYESWLIKKYGTLQKDGTWYYCADNARFVNHSNRPNTYDIYDECGNVVETKALYRIAKGEEIFEDYRCITEEKTFDFDLDDKELD